MNEINTETRMNTEEAVAALDAISGGDPEGAHCDADEVLRRVVPIEVVRAYYRVIERAGAWWYA